MARVRYPHHEEAPASTREASGNDDDKEGVDSAVLGATPLRTELSSDLRFSAEPSSALSAPAAALSPSELIRLAQDALSLGDALFGPPPPRLRQPPWAALRAALLVCRQAARASRARRLATRGRRGARGRGPRRGCCRGLRRTSWRCCRRRTTRTVSAAASAAAATPWRQAAATQSEGQAQRRHNRHNRRVGVRSRRRREADKPGGTCRTTACGARLQKWGGAAARCA